MSHEPLNLSATDPFDLHAKEHPFVASVVSSGWVLFRTHAPLLLLFGIPLIAIQTDAVWFNFPLGKGATIPGPWERSVMSCILARVVRHVSGRGVAQHTQAGSRSHGNCDHW